jgi:hypothetical protein
MIHGIVIHTGTVRGGVSIMVSATLTRIMVSPTDTLTTTVLIPITVIMTGIIRITEVHTGMVIMTDIMRTTDITMITGLYITARAEPLNRSVHRLPRVLPGTQIHHRMWSEDEPPAILMRPVPVVLLPQADMIAATGQP